MKNGSQTTHIMLDRGTEDLALLAELNTLVFDKGYNSFSQKFPVLLELRANLEKERHYCNSQPLVIRKSK